MQKVLIFLGPPGSGKGTQAGLLKAKYNFYHISTGDLIRKEISENSELGKKVKEYFAAGLLVPDNIVIEILKNAFVAIPKNASVIIDGFPRTIEQARELEKILIQLNTDKIFVFYFKVNEETVVERISGRRVCSNCNTIYHIKTNPSKAGEFCQNCNGKLIQREDDKKEAVLKRLSEYSTKTSPLLNFYKERNLLYEINAQEPPEIILNTLLSKIFSTD